jgi:hypothetical protein
MIKIPAQIRFLSKRPHTTTKTNDSTNDNTNMDNIIAGSMNTPNRLMTYLFWSSTKTINFLLIDIKLIGSISV